MLVSEQSGLRAWFPEETEAEFREIARAYRKESDLLGEAFESAVRRGVALIEQFPEAAPVAGGIVRRRVLRRFPFSHFYVIESDRIRILAIAHHRRRPGYWAARHQS
jgi:plasmid stabilization system protein ParE